jgi:hypothetical protein
VALPLNCEPIHNTSVWRRRRAAMGIAKREMIIMRYQSWMLLFAGLFTLPHLSYSADGWAAPTSHYGSFVPSAGPAADPSRFGAYAPPVKRANTPHYPEMAAPMGVQDYRFRPWHGSAGDAAKLARKTQNVPQPYADRSWPTRGYRFRPLPPAPQARRETALRYRPLRVQIPDRYVFRPLNPVTRSAAPRRSQPPAALYPPVGYPMAGREYLPYAYTPSYSGFYRPYTAGSHRPAPWQGVAPVYRQPHRLAPNTTYPATVAQGMQYKPRFRPWAYRGRGWNRTSRAGYRQRYAGRHPARQYPLPAPAWAYQYRAPNYAHPGYGFGERTVQRLPSPPARLNRYGTDWYDGRGDGEGAWYRLVMESAPAVSQSRQARSGIGGERD